MISNKKGAEESGGSIVIFLLVIAVALVVGLGTYTFFNRVDTSINAQGIETTNMILSCQKDLALATTDEAKFAAYCGNFREPFVIGKKDSFVNCEYLVRRSVAAFTVDEVPQIVKSKCSVVVSNKLAYNKCLEFNGTRSQGESWTEYINGIKCTKTVNFNDFSLTAEQMGDIKAESSVLKSANEAGCLVNSDCQSGYCADSGVCAIKAN